MTTMATKRANPNDEDNTPDNDHIFSVDKPCLSNASKNPKTGFRFKISIMQANFKEYVRVRFDGKSFDKVDIGSRCSLKTKWYCRSIVEFNKAKGVWDFISPKTGPLKNYQPFGCDLGHKALVNELLP